MIFHRELAFPVSNIINLLLLRISFLPRIIPFAAENEFFPSWLLIFRERKERDRFLKDFNFKNASMSNFSRKNWDVKFQGLLNIFTNPSPLKMKNKLTATSE